MDQEKNIDESAKEQPIEKEPSTIVTPGEIVSIIFESLVPNCPPEVEKKRDEIIKKYLSQSKNIFSLSNDYNVLILYDKGQMVKSDADNIYSAITDFKNEKPLLLILYSTGGSIGSAYLIGKLCREYSNGKFLTVVPRHAKSAATLISCAADEIHMGSLSELGPIDPQIDGLPALGLKSSIEHIADLVKQYPAAAEMFAKYLNLSINPIHIGYYERVAQSSMQYAERLLKTHESNLGRKAEQIANQLVYTYKEHGFIIDVDEAKQIFGEKIVKKNSQEYDLGNLMYQSLEFVYDMAGIKGYNFYFIGSCDSKPNFVKRISK